MPNITTNPGRLFHLPMRLDEAALINVLDELGVRVPPATAVAAREGHDLAVGHRFERADVETAMASTALSRDEKNKIIAALSEHNILQR